MHKHCIKLNSHLSLFILILFHKSNLNAMKKKLIVSSFLLLSAFTFAQTKGTKTTPAKTSTTKTSTTKTSTTSKPTTSTKTTPAKPVEKIKVEYELAKNYFKRNDIKFAGNQHMFDSRGIFEQFFGMATTMGEEGKPTPIDFSKQFVVALQEPDSNRIAEFNIKSFTKTGGNLNLTYSVKYGEALTYTSSNTCIIIVDKKFAGKISCSRTVEVPTLKIAPLENSGNLGQVTFSTQESTWFYYNQKTKTGEINLDGKTYKLTDYTFVNNQGKKGKKDGYILKGEGVTVNAPNMTVTDNSSGGDCIYGKIPVVTITLNGAKLILKNVAVQDCPDY